MESKNNFQTDTFQQSTKNFEQKNLVNFLRNTADSVEYGLESNEKIQKIGEFYMSYRCLENKNNETYDDMDIMKFVILGWYIYSIIRENKTEEQAPSILDID